MSKYFNVSTNQLLRDLTKVLKQVEDYPKTKLGAPRITIQYKNNKVFQAILRKNLLINLHDLGGGFASGHSMVESELKVEPGSGENNRGVAAYKAGFKTTKRGDKAFKIARIWDQGGTIFPRKVRYLTQPLSHGKRIALSPEEYNNDQHIAQFYPGRGSASNHPLISQSVHGLMVIRKKPQRSLVRRKKGEKRNRGEHVATFLVLHSQTHKPSYWISHAAKKTRTEILPLMIKTGQEYIRSQKVLS